MYVAYRYLVYIVRRRLRHRRALPVRLPIRLGRRGRLLGRVKVHRTVGLDHPLAVHDRPRAGVRVVLPVARLELLHDLRPLGLDGLALLRLDALGRNPPPRERLVLGDDPFVLLEQPVARLRVLHAVILARHRLDVRVLPVLLALELLRDFLDVNVLLKILDVIGEVDLAGNDGVEPALDDFPDA